MKRRNLFLAAGVLPVLAACTNDTPEEDNDNAVSDGGGMSDNGGEDTYPTQDYSLLMNTVLMNGALVFGPKDFYVSKTIVLDLGSTDSQKFFNEHISTIQKSYNDDLGLGLSLVDYSDADESNGHYESFALNASSVAVTLFNESPDMIWDYMSSVFDLLGEEDSDQSHHASDMSFDDFVNMAIDQGSKVSLEQYVADFSLTQNIVANMSMVAQGMVDKVPEMLDNHTPWDGDLNDSQQVKDFLGREY